MFYMHLWFPHEFCVVHLTLLVPIKDTYILIVQWAELLSCSPANYGLHP